MKKCCLFVTMYIFIMIFIIWKNSVFIQNVMLVCNYILMMNVVISQCNWVYTLNSFSCCASNSICKVLMTIKSCAFVLHGFYLHTGALRCPKGNETPSYFASSCSKIDEEHLNNRDAKGNVLGFHIYLEHVQSHNRYNLKRVAKEGLHLKHSSKQHSFNYRWPETKKSVRSVSWRSALGIKLWELLLPDI